MQKEGVDEESGMLYQQAQKRVQRQVVNRFCAKVKTAQFVLDYFLRANKS